jgi:hypothetical protein
MSADVLMATFAELRARIESGDWGEAERLMQKATGMLPGVTWTSETLAEAKRMQALCEQSAISRIQPMRQAVRRSADGRRATHGYQTLGRGPSQGFRR